MKAFQIVYIHPQEENKLQARLLIVCFQPDSRKELQASDSLQNYPSHVRQNWATQSRLSDGPLLLDKAVNLSTSIIFQLHVRHGIHQTQIYCPSY